MERKGKTTNSKHTKHIKVFYFFITDKVSKKEVTMNYCHTKEMLADISTKPVQGAKFREMRAHLMNCPLDYCEHEHTAINIGTCIR